MGLFDMFKKKDAAPSFPVVLAADAAGAFVKMEDIPDEVFAQGILGQGCGIDPSEENHLSDGCDPAAECWDRLEQYGLVRTGKYPAEFCIQHALYGASHNVCKFYHRSSSLCISDVCGGAPEWNGPFFGDVHYSQVD